MNKAMAIMLTILTGAAAGMATSGCAATRPDATPTIVRVPVAAECPAPPEVYRPALAIEALSPTATPPEVFQAYVSSMYALMGYAEQLEAYLSAYRKPSGPAAKPDEKAHSSEVHP